jgi:hypothetical protein
MSRVPNAGPAERDRQRLIRKLEADLRARDAIPAARRVDELADIRTETCLALLGDLHGGLPVVPAHRSCCPTFGS